VPGIGAVEAPPALAEDDQVANAVEPQELIEALVSRTTKHERG